LTPGTTTLTTPLNILKTNCNKMLIVQTNVNQLTANSPINIIHTPRNTVKKTQPALYAQEDLSTLTTDPLDQMKTHKMEYDMFNVGRTMTKEYEEYVAYKEYEEINTVKKPQPALNALPTIATAPRDQVETHKMEFAMFNTEGALPRCTWSTRSTRSITRNSTLTWAYSEGTTVGWMTRRGATIQAVGQHQQLRGGTSKAATST
jgi:hypothetical protein